MNRSAFIRGLLDDPRDPQLPQSVPQNDFGPRAYGLLNALMPDPYEAAGEAVQQFRAGNPIDAFETMFGAMPATGTILGGKALDRGTVKLAEQLKASGKTPQEIFDRTKLWEGASAQHIDPDAASRWRSEGVSDDKMRFKVEPLYNVGRKMPITTLIKHDELFDTVPELKRLEAAIYPGSRSQAYYAPQGQFADLPNGGIVLGRSLHNHNPEGLLGVVGHELQHGTQDVLKMPPGGSPSAIIDYQPEIQHNAQKFAGTPLGDLYKTLSIGSAKDDLAKMLADLRYEKMSGEQEAFPTGYRLGMSHSNREALPLFSTAGDINYRYSYPVDKHIAVPNDLFQRLMEQRFGGPIPPAGSLI